MRPHVTLALVCTGLVASGAFFGCMVPVDPGEVDEATATAEEAYANFEPGYFSIRNNTDCKIRLCSGYFVKEVNSRKTERHVDILRFVDADLESKVLADYRRIPDGGLVVRGFIGPSQGPWAKKPFVVMGAFRGMPGVDIEHGDTYYRVSYGERPHIFLATELNGQEFSRLMRVDVSRAAMPHVDMEWLRDRVMSHDAIVAGHVHPATLTTGLLDVSQVYLKMPDERAACRAMEPTCGPGKIAGYQRDVERCLVFDHCIESKACYVVAPGSLPNVCAEGYRPTRWTADLWSCTDVVCDPAFVDE